MQNEVMGSCQILSDTGYDNNYYYHSVRLTGLEADRFYYYRVITGTLQSSALRFRTQPLPGMNPGVYRVLILGDHQIKSNDHYERLMKAARQKVLEKYGGTIEEQISLIINNGDQVDAGTLDQYENVHFRPSAFLSGNIPVMTTVGNHETYGSLGLSAYYQHFFYDGLGYKGIMSPGVENYYSYQQGSIVFVHLSSEHPTDEQKKWVQQIMDSVKSDASVNWVISVAHRPIQAEQFVGDISEYVRDQIIPILAQTKKSTLFISGHHHLYARGQVRDYPMYHIISGAASWDQFWGQSTEKDFDDVQKTIDYWAYQIATFDDSKGEMSVESYTIGSPKLGLTMSNVLIDNFYRKPDLDPPLKPSIITVPADTITLPFTFTGSSYFSPASEPINSTQFQICPDTNFSINKVDLIRDYENLYGTTGSPDYQPVDIHKNLDILGYTIKDNKLPDGTYYVRTRHRDRNIEWSEWSGHVKFTIKGSVTGFTSLSTQKKVYEPNEIIIVNYQFGPGNAKDWIGIYSSGDTPGSTPSTDWKYTAGSSGTLNLAVARAGKYFVAFFENDGYGEIADRISLYVSKVPVLSLNKAGYAVGEEIQVAYVNAPGFTYDWIGIYKLADTPGVAGSSKWDYTSGSSGAITFNGLTAGYYFVSYFLEDQYTEASERVIFSIGSNLARLTADQATYVSGQSIRIDFIDGPGTDLDWIGLFRQNASPGTAPLVDRQYVANKHSGSVLFDLLLDPGDYYTALFINNSTIQISNKVVFTVESGSFSFNPETGSVEIAIYPSPSNGWFRVRTSNLQNSDLYMRILNSSGAIVFEKKIQALNSDFSDEIDLSEAPPGIYLVTMQSRNSLITKRIVVK